MQAYWLTEIQKYGQCTYNVTLRLVRATIVVVGKQCVTYSECVFVALGVRHAMRMRRIVICGLPSFTVLFTHCVIKGTIFEKKLY